MSSCSLGVHAFRPGVQVAAHHLSRRCTRSLLAAAFSTRCLPSLPARRQQQQQQHQQAQYDTTTTTTTRHGGRVTVATTPLAPLRNAGLPARGILRQWAGIRTVFSGFTVVTHYVDLPPNYTDHEGLPFARRDLRADEVVALFGPRLSTAAANKLLRILHGRRVAGTLEDPAVQVNTMHYTKEQQRIALEYLRKKVPVDEVANAGLRAEDELAALEEGATAAGQEGGGKTAADDGPGYTTRLKLYKDAPADSDKSKQPKQQQQQQKQQDVYGRSALDEIRAQNEAKWKAELARREEERRKREQEARDGKAGPLQVLGAQGQQTRQPSLRMQEWTRRGMSDLKEPPRMSVWQRLLPSAALVLAVAGACAAFAALYRPPRRADRLFPDVPPAAATVGGLVLANGLVWALWKVPPLWRVLNQYFVVSAGLPRAPAVLASMFSHQSLMHLLQNMVILWFLGVRLHDDVGRGDFLATYFGTGAAGTFGTLAFAVLRNQMDFATLGASAAVYGVGAAYLWMHRFDHFKVLGFPPPPSEGFHGLSILALAAAMNIGGFFTAKRYTVDLPAHLAGLAAGVLVGHLLERKREAKRRQRLQAENAAAAAGGTGKTTVA